MLEKTEESITNKNYVPSLPSLISFQVGLSDTGIFSRTLSTLFKEVLSLEPL